MSIKFKNADGTSQYLAEDGTGDGSSGSPFVGKAAAGIGAPADSAASSDGGTFSLIALVKRLLGKFPSSIGQKAKSGALAVTLASDEDLLGRTPSTLGQKAMASSFAVAVASDQSSIPVTGTFYQATQPVSAASLPLPTGAATATLQGTGNTSLSSIDGKIAACNTGAVTIASALPAGTNAIGGVTHLANTGGGRTNFKLDAAGTTQDSTQVKSSAGTVVNLVAYSTGSRDLYLKFYDSVGAVTVGTTTPAKKFKIPAGGEVVLGTTFPLEFANRVHIALTVNSGDTDTTSVNAGEAVVCLDWK